MKEYTASAELRDPASIWSPVAVVLGGGSPWFTVKRPPKKASPRLIGLEWSKYSYSTISLLWLSAIWDNSVLSSFRAGSPRTVRSLLNSDSICHCGDMVAKSAGRVSGGHPSALRAFVKFVWIASSELQPRVLGSAALAGGFAVEHVCGCAIGASRTVPVTASPVAVNAAARRAATAQARLLRTAAMPR